MIKLLIQLVFFLTIIPCSFAQEFTYSLSGVEIDVIDVTHLDNKFYFCKITSNTPQITIENALSLTLTYKTVIEIHKQGVKIDLRAHTSYEAQQQILFFHLRNPQHYPTKINISCSVLFTVQENFTQPVISKTPLQISSIQEFDVRINENQIPAKLNLNTKQVNSAITELNNIGISGYGWAHIIAIIGQIDLMEKYIAIFPNALYEIDQQGITPLFIAAAKGNLALVQWMIFRDSRLLFVRNTSFNTAAHMAALNHRNIIYFLIQYWPTILTEANSNGETPIHYAARVFNDQLLLFTASVNPSQLFKEDNNKIIPLDYYIIADKMAVVFKIIATCSKAYINKEICMAALFQFKEKIFKNKYAYISAINDYTAFKLCLNEEISRVIN